MWKYIFALLLCTLPAQIVIAQTAPQNNNEFFVAPITNPPEVVNFPLNEEFLTRMEEIQKDILSIPPEEDPYGTGNDNSIEGLTASVAGRPLLMDILQRHNVTPRDYVVGYMALSSTLLAVSSLQDSSEQFFDDSKIVSSENLEFGKQYTDRIRDLLGG